VSLVFSQSGHSMVLCRAQDVPSACWEDNSTPFFIRRNDDARQLERETRTRVFLRDEWPCVVDDLFQLGVLAIVTAKSTFVPRKVNIGIGEDNVSDRQAVFRPTSSPVTVPGTASSFVEPKSKLAVIAAIAL